MERFTKWLMRNNRNLITILLLLLSFTLILSTGLRIYQNDQENLVRRYLYHQFDPDENTAEGSDQYLDHVPMEEMDFSALGIHYAYAPVGFEQFTVTITLPSDLTYYREEQGIKIPALTLKKGSLISIEYKATQMIPFGYGYRTYPTYERGWRYAIPFQTGEEPYEGTQIGKPFVSQQQADYYYVKLSDIEKVLRLLLEATDEQQGEASSASQKFGQRMYNSLFNIDHWLASENIYLSPDIGGSVFTKWDYILLAASAGCFLLALLSLFFSYRKKCKNYPLDCEEA